MSARNLIYCIFISLFYSVTLKKKNYEILDAIFLIWNVLFLFFILGHLNILKLKLKTVHILKLVEELRIKKIMLFFFFFLQKK